MQYANEQLSRSPFPSCHLQEFIFKSTIQGIGIAIKNRLKPLMFRSRKAEKINALVCNLSLCYSQFSRNQTACTAISLLLKSHCTIIAPLWLEGSRTALPAKGKGGRMEGSLAAMGKCCCPTGSVSNHTSAVLCDGDRSRSSVSNTDMEDLRLLKCHCSLMILSPIKMGIKWSPLNHYDCLHSTNT